MAKCPKCHVSGLERAAEIADLLDFAIEMTGEPDCWYDHHGYCQAHNLQPKGECWVELGKVKIAAIRAEKDEI